MYPPKEGRHISIRLLAYAVRKWRSALKVAWAHLCCKSRSPLTTRREAHADCLEAVATKSRDAKNCAEFRNLDRLGTSIVQRLVRKADLSRSPLAFTFGLFNARRGVLHVLPT